MIRLRYTQFLPTKSFDVDRNKYIKEKYIQITTVSISLPTYKKVDRQKLKLNLKENNVNEKPNIAYKRTNKQTCTGFSGRVKVGFSELGFASGLEAAPLPLSCCLMNHFLISDVFISIPSKKKAMRHISSRNK